MKIAFVIHHINNWGGQERSTLEIINRFAKSHEVHVYACTVDGLDPKVIFHRINPVVKKPFFVKDFIFRILVSFKMLGQRFDVVNATGNCCFHSNVITIQFVQQRWRLERPKIQSKTTWRTALQAIQSFYDVLWEKIIYGMLRNKWYIALSDSVAEDLKRFYGIKKVVVIPHGVNLREFAPSSSKRLEMRKRLGVSESETLLLFVGTFERKGLFFLLPAFAKLASKHNAKLCVVGLGPVERAKDVCRKLGIENRVLFTGHTRDVVPYYQAGDLFILPSLYDPFGLVGIEALASGLPSIVSVQSGVSSHIADGINGYLLKNPDSENEIENKLELLLSRKSEIAALSKSARESVLQASWDQVWPEYDKLFSEASRT
jgi:UDP-glucose:(heptosyl)LPS alpha-1,3-glucosyltransferase